MKKKSAPKKSPAEPVDRNNESNSSDQDDPPRTREEVQASLSEQVNITTSITLPNLRESTAPIAPPKKIIMKRKTPRTTTTMVDHVNTHPHPEAINMQDLVVDAPVSTAKPDQQIPKPKVKKIKAPSAEQSATQADVLKEKAAKFAPTMTQPLDSMPPSEQVQVPTAPVA